jgi:sec-independent protein translocase protein TatA
MSQFLALLDGLNPTHLLVVLVVGVLLFGSRLPEIGRSLGKAMLEFSNGLKGIDNDIAPHSTTPRPSLRG